jgi:hypothetical protein
MTAPCIDPDCTCPNHWPTVTDTGTSGGHPHNTPPPLGTWDNRRTRRTRKTTTRRTR